MHRCLRTASKLSGMYSNCNRAIRCLHTHVRIDLSTCDLSTFPAKQIWQCLHESNLKRATTGAGVAAIIFLDKLRTAPALAKLNCLLPKQTFFASRLQTIDC